MKDTISLKEMIKKLENEFQVPVYNGYPKNNPSDYIYIEVNNVDKIYSDNTVQSVNVTYNVFLVTKLPLVDFNFFYNLPWLEFVSNIGYNINQECYQYLLEFVDSIKLSNKTRVDLNG